MNYLTKDKNMENKVFFGENGLTSTSANHVANLAKEFISSSENYLNSISFVNCEVGLIGSDKNQTYSLGVRDLSNVESILADIAKCKALIAWLREAIKAKNSLISDINNLNIFSYCQLKEIPYPERPQLPNYLTAEKYYDSLPIKERNEYYSLEAEAATLGQFIHPGGNLSKQRSLLSEKLMHPIKSEGEGRDTVLYKYSPSISLTEVDDTFFKLQSKHREIQARLNGMKHLCEVAMQQDHLQKGNAYKAADTDYSAKMHEIENECNIYKEEELAKVQNLKIVIPNSLESIYKKIQSLGK